MTHSFTTHFFIRQYELNAQSDLPNSTLWRLFQEAATQTTRDAGFGLDWFDKHKTVWLVRGMTVERLGAIRYPDEMAITSWLSDAHKVHVHREYLARNAVTGVIVARGRANWVHVNAETFFPARIPADVTARFAPNGIRAVPQLEARAFAAPLAPREFHTQRRVQRYEADAMQHVNNAIYVDWLEETLTEAVADLTSASQQLCVRRHDIEYLRSALPGDVIEIGARLHGAGHCASDWRLEITRGEELLVRDRITAFWRDQNGKPQRGKW